MILLDPVIFWMCGKCDQRKQSNRRIAPLHQCPNLHMMMVPLVEVGTKADVRLVGREDYINGDDVQLDEDGRPWAGAEVVRDDGVDSYGYAAKAGR